MRRYRAKGDPGEFGDWLVAVIDLRSEEEPALAAALDELVERTRDMDAFLSFVPGDELEAARHYTLRFAKRGDLASAQHEREFWPVAARHPSLRERIARYVVQVNAAGDEYNWQDEFHHSGAFAIAELALVDAAWCSLLGRLLFHWDMGHETFHEALIDQLFSRHGLVDGTAELLACRICADGQASDDQCAAALYDHDFKPRLDLDDFARRCVRFSSCNVSADLGMEHFALIYADGNPAEYEKVWAAFVRAGTEFRAEGFDPDESRARAARRTTRRDEHWDKHSRDASTETIDKGDGGH